MEEDPILAPLLRAFFFRTPTKQAACIVASAYWNWASVAAWNGELAHFIPPAQPREHGAYVHMLGLKHIKQAVVIVCDRFASACWSLHQQVHGPGGWLTLAIWLELG